MANTADRHPTVRRQIAFTKDEFLALRNCAWDEAREAQQMARWIIRDYLINKGYLDVEPTTSPPKE
jgi:hypothetical protein